MTPNKKICGAAEKVQKAGTGAAVCTVLTTSRGQGASAQGRDMALRYNLRYTFDLGCRSAQTTRGTSTSNRLSRTLGNQELFVAKIARCV
jgi:hypothetical protein